MRPKIYTTEEIREWEVGYVIYHRENHINYQNHMTIPEIYLQVTLCRQEQYMKEYMCKFTYIQALTINTKQVKSLKEIGGIYGRVWMKERGEMS